MQFKTKTPDGTEVRQGHTDRHQSHPVAPKRTGIWISLLGVMASLKEGLSLGPPAAMHFDAGFSPSAGIHRSQNKQRLRKRRSNAYNHRG